MQVADLRAMLITAGFGTRLSPLTDYLPKPAVPIANRPAAWFALDHLRRAGISDFVFNTHHLAAELERAMRQSAPADVQLRFVHEPQILGTGGGIKNAWQPAPRRDETFVVMSGKYVYAPDVAAALALHEASDVLATLIVKEVPPTDPIGVVRLDSAGLLAGIPGHAAVGKVDERCFMYTGLSLLSSRAHAELPDNGCLIRDGYARWLARGGRIAAYVDTASFRDVGMSLGHYHEANLAFATGRLHWPGIECASAQGLCNASARIEAGATLRECVVGARARIAAGVHLEGCVVWPDTDVTTSCSDAILLPNGRVTAVTPRPRQDGHDTLAGPVR